MLIPWTKPNEVYFKGNIKSTLWFWQGIVYKRSIVQQPVLLQDVDCEVFACFVVFEKAVGNAKRCTLMNILWRIEVESADGQIIKILYWQKKVKIRI